MLLLMMLAAGCAQGPARGDGILLAPGKLLQSFAEQIQLAVVEVRPDETVEVDLFISLLDESGESREVHFLLPLQTMPGEFRAAEHPLAEFWEQEIEPLERLFHEAAAAERRHRRAIQTAVAVGSLPAGPLAAAIQWYRILGGGHRGMGAIGQAESSVAPVLSVETRHARADVYEALDAARLAKLARLPELPRIVSESLSAYVGRPYALVRLQTQPRGEVAPDEHWIPPEQHPGLHFTFTQDLVMRDGARSYDYPLGTGQAWEQPIPLTQVYVTAPDDMILEVEFPGRPRGAGDGVRKVRGKSLAYAADGRQVHRATYDHSNPKEDVRVALRGRGASEFAGAEQQRRRHRTVAWLIFPLLGVAAWLSPCGVLVWPHRYSKALAVWRSAGLGWGVGAVGLSVPLLLLVWPAARRCFVSPLRDLARRGDVVRFVAETEGALAPALLFLGCLVVVALVGAGLVYVVRQARKPGFGAFAIRATVTALVAAVVYLVVGLQLQDWLTK